MQKYQLKVTHYSDKKLSFKDNSQENELEVKASEHDLSYVSLDGNIACMVNGAGLAMATMDLTAARWRAGKFS